MAVISNKVQRMRRHMRIRKKVSGTALRPRFCVSVTANNLYCQFIDDENGVTIFAISSLNAQFKADNGKPNMEGAAVLGKLAAEAAMAKGVSEVVFDRSGYRYHGRVKAIAEAAREQGLKF